MKDSKMSLKERKNLKANLERLIDDKPNLHETSAVEGALILL